MKSIQKLKEETKLNNKELLEMLHDVCRYYLCDEDIEPFMIKYKEIKLNCHHSKKIQTFK